MQPILPRPATAVTYRSEWPNVLTAATVGGVGGVAHALGHEVATVEGAGGGIGV